MGFLDIFTNVDDLLKHGLNSIIGELKILNSKFSANADNIIVNPTDTSIIESLLHNIETILHSTEARVSSTENRLHEINATLNDISGNLTSGPMGEIDLINNSLGAATETVVLEGKDIPASSIQTVELPTPFGGIITNIQVVGHEKLVNMELYLGGNRKFPYSTGGYFPTESMSFDTYIPVAGGQLIRGKFSNGDNNLPHTVQVYITIKEL